MNSRNIRRKYAQNYLIDPAILFEMATAIAPKENDTFIEIGPGHGALTNQINKENINIICIDIDSDNIDIMNNEFKGPANFKFINQDILNFELPSIDSKLRIVGNLPYNISTQIIFKVLEYKNRVPELIGMFQKEVAERICEKKGSKKYGILSVLTQTYYDTKYLFSVPASVFTPPPKVISAVIRLVRKEQIDINYNEKLFFKVVKLSFQQRRKTLRNSLKSFNLSDILREDAIFDLRPEQLSVRDFIYITDLIDKNI